MLSKSELSWVTRDQLEKIYTWVSMCDLCEIYDAEFWLDDKNYCLILGDQFSMTEEEETEILKGTEKAVEEIDFYDGTMPRVKNTNDALAAFQNLDRDMSVFTRMAFLVTLLWTLFRKTHDGKSQFEKVVREDITNVLEKERLVDLDGQLHKRLLNAMKQWSDGQPVEPVLCVGDEFLTPEEIVFHFEKQDRIGKLLLSVIQNALVNGHKLEEIISGFEKNPPI